MHYGTCGALLFALRVVGLISDFIVYKNTVTKSDVKKLSICSCIWITKFTLLMCGKYNYDITYIMLNQIFCFQQNFNKSNSFQEILLWNSGLGIPLQFNGRIPGGQRWVRMDLIFFWLFSYSLTKKIISDGNWKCLGGFGQQKSCRSAPIHNT